MAPEEVAAALAGASEGRGADVVVLTAGAPALVRAAFGWVRDGGAVHLFVGEGEGPLPVGELYKRELTLTATYSSSPADLAEAFDLIRSGAVRVAELCSHRVPLEAPGRGGRSDGAPRGAQGVRRGGRVRAQVFYGPGDLRLRGRADSRARPWRGRAPDRGGADLWDGREDPPARPSGHDPARADELRSRVRGDGRGGRVRVSAGVRPGIERWPRTRRRAERARPAAAARRTSATTSCSSTERTPSTSRSLRDWSRATW